MLYTCFTYHKGWLKIRARGPNHAHEKADLPELIVELNRKDIAIEEIGIRAKKKIDWTEEESVLVENGIYVILICGFLIREAEFLGKVKLSVFPFLLFQKNGKKVWVFKPKIAVSNKRRDL